jgi:limonene-1,2-epoxide hydrolase
MPDNPSKREIRNDALIREFVDTFAEMQADLLGPYFSEDIVFENYGDPELRGRASLVNMWAGVFRSFAQVRFETLHQVVSGDLVIAEQVHGLGLPGKPLAPIKNLAVYEIHDGQIAAWRDYTNPQKARQLLGLWPAVRSALAGFAGCGDVLAPAAGRRGLPGKRAGRGRHRPGRLGILDEHRDVARHQVVPLSAGSPAPVRCARSALPVLTAPPPLPPGRAEHQKQ